MDNRFVHVDRRHVGRFHRHRPGVLDLDIATEKISDHIPHRMPRR